MAKNDIIFKYGIILTIFSAVAGMILAAVFQVTEPRRIVNNQKLEVASRQEVLPTASQFAKAKIGDYGFVKGLDKNKKLCGYILKAQNKGYSSNLEILVGISVTGNVIGLKILSQSETPGLGTKVTAPWFTRQFIGRPRADMTVKKDGGAIAAITGATISSRAVTNGVRKEIEKFLKIKGV
jgi:electron transport complex protein RnfG